MHFSLEQHLWFDVISFEASNSSHQEWLENL